METRNKSQQNNVHVKTDYIDCLKAANASSRTSKKRKDNPIEIKYETTTNEINLKSDQNEVKLDKNNKNNFVYMFEKIKEMRKNLTAPVDTMGCHCCPDKKAPKDVWDFQLLVSLMLSVQTKDEATFKAMTKLKENNLTVESINKMDESKILELISGVNFNKTKAKNIKAAAKLITEKYNKKVPKDWKQLLEFPGIGNKITVLYLNIAYHMNVGIGVDTHVHRISNRVGWVNTKLPEQTRVELEKFVPKEYWSDINHWMVGFGQETCQPINPKCEVCLLNNVCPEGKRKMRYVKKGKGEEAVDMEDFVMKYTKKKKGNEVGGNKEGKIKITVKKKDGKEDEKNENVKNDEEEKEETIKKTVSKNNKKK